MQPPRQAEEQREGVFREVNAHAALLAGERNVALHELGAEDRIHARADRVVEAQALVQDEDVGRDPAEQDVGVDDLRPLARAVLGFDQDGARSGRFENGAALHIGERRHDHDRGVEDLHERVTSVTMRRVEPIMTPAPQWDVGTGILPRSRDQGGAYSQTLTEGKLASVPGEERGAAGEQQDADDANEVALAQARLDVAAGIQAGAYQGQREEDVQERVPVQQAMTA